jgi:hypothetical protein
MMYLTGEAMPLKVGKGSNEIVPSTLTVYVPSFAIVNDVSVQLVFTVEVVAHNFTLEATRAPPLPGESLVRTETVCTVSYAPEEVSFVAEGAGEITGVKVDVADWPKISTALYVMAVFDPAVAAPSATYVTTPVAASSV